MIHYEDIVVGQVSYTEAKRFERQEIIDFARRYDPQIFHVDEAAAKETIFGGLIASGWHTASVMMGLMIEAAGNKAHGLGSPGFDDLRWHRPVRPGDSIRVRIECVEKRPSRSKPWMGSAHFRIESFNQRDELVLSMLSIGLYKRREGQTDPREERNG